MAIWLNTAFYSFDKGVFYAMHSLYQSTGWFFTPFFKVVSFFGEKGIFFIVLSIVLMLFSKTRRVGFSMLLAIGVGALLTNVIIKNAVARPRPYTVEEFKLMWQSVGAVTEKEFSFPSGHTTVSMTALTVVFLSFNKKRSWTVYIFVFMMCLSRIYLIVHYATDVIVGVMVGGVSGTIAFFLSKYLFSLLIKHKDKRACKFMLDSDIVNLFKKNKD